MIGKTLLHYEILEPLGAGGMGEVYRARDTSLNRDVAVKVLPRELSADPDRLARLEREAHLLAALNHSNIATIHALEEEEGTRFLVLEFVKGESLEQWLSRGPLPVEKALEVCKQIAEALEAAHGEGIIHRDLKPANVLITPAGQVKVLDFGIAKSMTVDIDLAATSNATNLTVAGTLVGTPAYMSPEQVRDEPIDKRADIWAFGCLLYESLTARSAFGRETLADTLAAIVDQNPDWDELSRAGAGHVQVLIRRCLQKDPKRRLRDIGDAWVEIEESTVPAGLQDHPQRLSGWGAPQAVAAVVLAAVAATAGYYLRPAPEPATWLSHRVTTSQGAERQPSLAPDGNTVFYSGYDEDGDLDIFSKRIDGGSSTNLTADSPADDRMPAVSPDGALIAFRSERDGGGLYLMRPGGEDPVPLTDFGYDPA